MRFVLCRMTMQLDLEVSKFVDSLTPLLDIPPQPQPRGGILSPVLQSPPTAAATDVRTSWLAVLMLIALWRK